jgi:alpha-ketoglutarate-dependent taurine dioxygenase
MNLQESIAFMEQTGSMKLFNKFSNHIIPSHYNRPNGIHGMNHARRVLFFAELLAALEDLPETERDILATAAVYHDIGRTNDGVDYEHGYASFKKAEQFGLIRMENTEDYRTVKYLIAEHCIRDKDAFALVMNYGLENPEGGKRLLKFFKDADGLDRVRINDLNPAYLRLSTSKGLVQTAWELLQMHIPS